MIVRRESRQAWGIVVTNRELTHRYPAWRHEADFVLMHALDDSEPLCFEQLWAAHCGGDRYRICCIPFFVFGLSLGDVVRCEAAHGYDYCATEIVESSPRSTFRLYSADGIDDHAEIIKALESVGALVERSSRNMVAVDAADEQICLAAVELLQDFETSGRGLYEVGVDRTSGGAR